MNHLLAIFTNPKSVFEAQRDESSWLVPALAILVFSIASSIVVAMTIDPSVAIEQTVEMLEQQGAPQAQIDAVRESSQMAANPVMTIGSAALGGVIVFFVMTLLHAIYFWIVGKILSEDQDFSDWYALSVWGRMPWVITAIVTIVAVIAMDSQVDPTAYNLLAIATWIDIPGETSMFVGTLVKSLSLTTIWTIVILTIGFSSWTDRSMGVSAAIVAVPYVLIYGGMMAFG